MFDSYLRLVKAFFNTITKKIVYYIAPQQLNRFLSICIMKSGPNLRFAISCIFAVIATAALFSGLDFLISAKLPLQQAAANHKANIIINRVTIAPNKKSADKSRTTTSNQKLNKQIQKKVPINPVNIKSKTDNATKSLAATNNTALKPALIPKKTKIHKPKATKQPQKAIIPKKEDLAPNSPNAASLADQPIMEIKENNNLEHVIDNSKGESKPSKQLVTENKPAAKSDNIVYNAKDLKKIHSPYPKYPRKAKRRNIQGWIITEFKIRTDGSVDQIKIVDGKNTSFFKKEVLKTLASWRFARQHPQDIRASMRFVFTLRG